MTDLSHWDFAEDFNPFDATALIVGIEPDQLFGTALQDPAKVRSDQARMMPVSQRMSKCYAFAMVHYQKYLSPLIDKPIECKPDALHSLAMQSLLEKITPGDSKSEAPFDAWIFDSEECDFRCQRFSRNELTRWLAAIGMKSIYQFDRSKDSTTPISMVQADKPLAPRERDTLLNIIGALVELIQTAKPGRDSDAAVIKELLDNYSDKPGIKERTLQEKFAAAKRSLLSN